MKKTIEDIDVSGKKVLVRCDFNVPQDEKGNITDTRRIKGALPTIKYLIEHNAKVILCSHLGRPKGEVNPKFSLAPVQKELSKELGRDVKLSLDIVGENTKSLINQMQNGDVVLLENVRFDKREEQNDRGFSKELAEFADIYVNDAFGTAHRAHSTTAGVAEFLPAVSGFLIEKEIKFLGDSLNMPERPFVAIIGGKKVSDKITVINKLIEKVDALIIGGGMTYTFFKAMGRNIGNSICEDDKIELALELMKKAKDNNVKLILPVDTHVAREYNESSESMIVSAEKIPDGFEGLDIGPESIKEFSEVLKNAKTVIWNGPLGVFEMDKFAKGTNEVAKVLSELNAIVVVGGGDCAAAVEKAGVSDKITHISTGGGASLEYLEGKILPGIDCLEDK